MNNYLLFLILRLAILIPSFILCLSQGLILYRKWGNHNGMRPYRILLFLVTLAFTTDSAIVAAGDFAGAFLNVSHSQFFGGMTEIRILARLIELLTIWSFYKVVFDAKKDGPDHRRK